MSEYNEYIVSLSGDWAHKSGEKLTEIVRCRDCKFCRKNYCEKRISPIISPSEIFWLPVDPDGFCAWGKRETNNKTDDIVECCGDDRFELIAKAKAELLDATNIESSPTDMAALDSILFRCWQMGWLDQLRTGERRNDGQAQ